MISNLIRAGSHNAVDDFIKTFILTCLLILMFNCSLFKNTATDLHQSHELSTAIEEIRTVEHRDWLSKSGSLYLHQDSSNMDYSVQILPRGVFSFSSAGGFSGEADKVLLTGRIRAGSVSLDSSSSLQQDKGETRQQYSQQVSNVIDQKDKKKTAAPSWKWLVGILAFLGALSCFLYSKVKLFIKP